MRLLSDFSPESSSRRSRSPCSFRRSPTLSSAACTALAPVLSDRLDDRVALVAAPESDLDLVRVLVPVHAELLPVGLEVLDGALGARRLDGLAHERVARRRRR